MIGQFLTLLTLALTACAIPASINSLRARQVRIPVRSDDTAPLRSDDASL